MSHARDIIYAWQMCATFQFDEIQLLYLYIHTKRIDYSAFRILQLFPVPDRT